MDQRTLGTVAGDDVNAIVAALKRRLAIIEPEMALRPFRPMTSPAGLLEDRLDIALELDAYLRRRREFALVD